MKQSATLLFALFLSPLSSIAQESSLYPTAAFTDLDMLKSVHEKSFIFPYGGFGLQDRVFFEANVAPHLVYPWEIEGAGHFAIDITPKFVVRMFREESNPVRTPSYMPRGTLYYWWRSHDDWLKTNEEFNALFMTVSHHSNGQPPSNFFNPDGSINHVDGDFSTNFIELGLYSARRPGTPGDTEEELALKRRLSKLEQFGESISLEWHPGIDQTDELRGRYGMWRLNLRSNLSAVFGKLFFGTHVQLTTIFGPIIYENWYDRLIVSVGWIYTHKSFSDFGIYANLYHGQDYYNMRFDRIITAFRVGLIMNYTTMSGG